MEQRGELGRQLPLRGPLKADIHHANAMADAIQRNYGGACVQMRLSFSSLAPLFLYLIQWLDCGCCYALPSYLGLFHILICKNSSVQGGLNKGAEHGEDLIQAQLRIPELICCRVQHPRSCPLVDTRPQLPMLILHHGSCGIRSSAAYGQAETASGQHMAPADGSGAASSALHRHAAPSKED